MPGHVADFLQKSMNIIGTFRFDGWYRLLKKSYYAQALPETWCHFVQSCTCSSSIPHHFHVKP